MKELLNIVNRIKQAPGMYIIGETYGEFVALIYGYDLAQQNKYLEVFREWLIMKYNSGSNLVWSKLCLLILKIDLKSYIKGPNEDHIRAINGASDLLQSFYEEVEKYSIDQIHDDYQKWLKKQNWYGSFPVD